MSSARDAGDAEAQTLTGEQMQRKSLQSLQSRGISLYEVLDIPATADEDEIKRAYRSLARRFHPDKNQGQEAHEKFTDVSCAYKTLKNSSSRAVYDRLGYAGLLTADHLDSKQRRFVSRNPVVRAIYYFFFIITFGFFCYGFCFCCNCCCGHCKPCMTKVIGKKNMQLYEQAMMEAEIVEVVEENERRESRLSAATTAGEGGSRKASAAASPLHQVAAPPEPSPLSMSMSSPVSSGQGAFGSITAYDGSAGNDTSAGAAEAATPTASRSEASHSGARPQETFFGLAPVVATQPAAAASEAPAPAAAAPRVSNVAVV